jgi:hypothetical protein
MTNKSKRRVSKKIQKYSKKSQKDGKVKKKRKKPIEFISMVGELCEYRDTLLSK